MTKKIILAVLVGVIVLGAGSIWVVNSVEENQVQAAQAKAAVAAETQEMQMTSCKVAANTIRLQKGHIAGDKADLACLKTNGKSTK